MYGERDQLSYKEFRELTLDLPEEDIVVIPDGTHTYSTVAQKEQAIESTCEWLRRHKFRSALKRLPRSNTGDCTSHDARPPARTA